MRLWYHRGLGFRVYALVVFIINRDQALGLKVLGCSKRLTALSHQSLFAQAGISETTGPQGGP